ncbi:MAG TPA: PEGA domain-containing protein [Kofleriaceae bacterium]|nr:PEGA domain-containing protein [Kofleriaceae bacterium]
MTPRRSLSLLLVAGLAVQGAAVPAGFADPASPAAVKEAGKHFQRGVSLYTEADYRAALVEFRRAYEIAPNPSVLYNIGETYYQLQNYAAALTALQRYLNESGAGAQHRHDVEQTLDTLQSRVGKVAVTTNVPDCDIAIDDEPVGRTPLAEPLTVSVGRRKITVTHSGRATETRQIDVAAGDTVQLPLALVEAAGVQASGTSVASSVAPAKPSDGKNLITAGWVVTGVLGATAIGTGVFAYISSRQLKDLRDAYPANPSDIKSKSSRVGTLSAIADISGIATLIAGGLTLKLTLSHTQDHEAHLAIAPNGLQIAGTFQ